MPSDTHKIRVTKSQLMAVQIAEDDMALGEEGTLHIGCEEHETEDGEADGYAAIYFSKDDFKAIKELWARDWDDVPVQAFIVGSLRAYWSGQKGARDAE